MNGYDHPPGSVGSDLSRLVNGNQQNKNFPNKAGNSPWTLLASHHPQEPSMKPDPAQQTAMEQFQQLLNPVSISVAETRSDNNFFAMPKVAADPNINQPEFTPNPAGASFIPVLNSLGKPTGLNPLPGIVAPDKSPAAVPSWVPQPPPWLSQTPQPFTVPQRKF